MSDERGDAPKEEGAQEQTADKGKEKRVPTYFFPNFLLVAAMTVFCGPAALIWAPLSFAGACFIGSVKKNATERFVIVSLWRFPVQTEEDLL